MQKIYRDLYLRRKLIFVLFLFPLLLKSNFLFAQDSQFSSNINLEENLKLLELYNKL